MIVKVHNTGRGKVITIVDRDIIGKKFEEGKLQLDLTADFYQGEDMSKSEILDIVQSAYILHIIGRESVKWGEENGWISKHRIVRIQGVPHAEIVIIRD
jgi:uncharacterized protein